jgi:shikimate dehydrogenase
MTIYAEVIGDPIAQSKSPAIHNYWLERAGIEAQYCACHVTAEGLADYLAERRDDADWRGCNVTMPHKLAIMRLLDRLEIGAEMVGAVNTVTRRHDGTLIGSNTDGAGFIEPLRQDLASAHLFRMARVFGTGGAARAIVAALAEQGIVVVLAGRNPAKARTLLGRERHARSLLGRLQHRCLGRALARQLSGEAADSGGMQDDGRHAGPGSGGSGLAPLPPRAPGAVAG